MAKPDGLAGDIHAVVFTDLFERQRTSNQTVFSHYAAVRTVRFLFIRRITYNVIYRLKINHELRTVAKIQRHTFRKMLDTLCAIEEGFRAHASLQ